MYHFLTKPTEINISREEALSILQTVRRSPSISENGSPPPNNISSPRSRSALEMLQQEQNASCVVTFCERLDDMLGGGVPTGKITEFCGAPGIGKTQIG